MVDRERSFRGGTAACPRVDNVAAGLVTVGPKKQSNRLGARAAALEVMAGVVLELAEVAETAANVKLEDEAPWVSSIAARASSRAELMPMMLDTDGPDVAVLASLGTEDSGVTSVDSSSDSVRAEAVATALA